MNGGIQTFVLILHIMGGAHNNIAMVAIPGYGTPAECERAAVIAIDAGMATRAKCIPGPVEGR